MDSDSSCTIVLSFIGKLPTYIIECVHQIRIFFSGNIYLILNDFDFIYLSQLRAFSVVLVPYESVLSTEFSELVQRNNKKFVIEEKLGDRKELFIRSFERFFLLQNAMVLHELTNVLFLEIDILIYNDPAVWIEEFSQHELCYTFDNVDRCSGAFTYVNSADSLSGLLDFMTDYIETQSVRHGVASLDEMTCLYHYYKQNPTVVELLPIFWPCSSVNTCAYSNYDNYNTIFDALSIGCNMIGGINSVHELDVDGNPVIQKGNLRWSNVDYSKYRMQFEKDSQERQIPYIWNESQQKWIRINNLHVHSKELVKGISLPKLV